MLLFSIFCFKQKSFKLETELYNHSSNICISVEKPLIQIRKRETISHFSSAILWFIINFIYYKVESIQNVKICCKLTKPSHNPL